MAGFFHTSSFAQNAEARIAVQVVFSQLCATIDIRRRIHSAHRDAARAKGVPESEVNDTVLVARDHPVTSSIETWYDYRVRPGIEYVYSVRADDGAWRTPFGWLGS